MKTIDKKWYIYIDLLFYLTVAAVAGYLLYTNWNWKNVLIVSGGVTSLAIFLKVLNGDKDILEQTGKVALYVIGAVFWIYYSFVPFVLAINLLEPLGDWSWIGVLVVPALEFIFIIPLALFAASKMPKK